MVVGPRLRGVKTSKKLESSLLAVVWAPAVETAHTPATVNIVLIIRFLGLLARTPLPGKKLYNRFEF